jgi:hypothetical protein
LGVGRRFTTRMNLDTKNFELIGDDK